MDEPGPLKQLHLPWPISISLFPYLLLIKLYHIMPFPFSIHTFHQQFYPNLHANSRLWSQTADDSLPPACTASQIDSSGTSRQGGCLPLTGAALVLTENLLKSYSKLSCTFGTKSELALAQAKVSALSGAAKGKKFQLGKKSSSDG